MINRIKKIATRNTFCEHIIYLAYRICACIYSFLFLVCRIFPIKENKIVACNMKGKRYGDNPKYIFDEIIRQDLDYELVWLMKGERDLGMPEEIKCAPYNPFSLAYHLSTAKVWIDSNMKAIGTLKRKGQYYIQTWHGSYGLKRAGLDVNIKSGLFNTKPFYYNAKLEDLMVSNSRKTSEMFHSGFAYNGKILECGSPRNDIFFEDRKKYKDKVNQYFKIKGKKILLYAPTFRDDFSIECLHMNFREVLKALAQKFGGDWIVLVRLHPNNIQQAEKFMEYSDMVINATGYNIMQELLVASDALITDYSSSMFDFATTRKPCFIYAKDYSKYKTERDFYFNLLELPFPVALSNDELIKNVNNFDELSYVNKLEDLFKQVKLKDKGLACKQVVDYIEKLKE